MRPLLLLIFVFEILFFSGCQIFGTADSLESDLFTEAGPQAIDRQKIYIQSFTGQNVGQVQSVFFETAAEQSAFAFVELLPEDYTNLKILRLEVTDYSIWETTETLELNTEGGVLTPGQVLRRNAVVGFRVSLYEAETGKLLLRKPYSQPFQQIYVGTAEIDTIPQKSAELRRLAKTLVYKLLADFYQAKSEPLAMELEKGMGHDWLSRTIYNLGNSRIKKGNRFAEAAEYEKAIWMWQLVLYETEDNEPLDIYQKNRASAYFNLGVIYHKLGDWIKAAEMYSMANRMEQKLKYAQAWGNTMHLWIEAQKEGENYIDEISPKSQENVGILKPVVAEVEKKEEKTVNKSEILRSMERNEQLLLNARELWPLEPALKAIEPPALSSPEETGNNLDGVKDEAAIDAQGDHLIKPVEMGDSEFDGELIKQVPETTPE